MGLLEAIGTILGIALVMVARDWRDGKHPFKRNGSYDAQQTLKQILQSQQALRTHYNDDTTRVLEEIRDELKGGFKDIRIKHAEWDKYGIKTAECPK